LAISIAAIDELEEGIAAAVYDRQVVPDLRLMKMPPDDHPAGAERCKHREG
jgi:hypothetical protein